MGNYVMILNWDKKQYIDNSCYHFKIQNYLDHTMHHCFSSSLNEALHDNWRGDRIGTYDEHAIEKLMDEGKLPENFYSVDQSEWRLSIYSEGCYE